MVEVNLMQALEEIKQARKAVSISVVDTMMTSGAYVRRIIDKKVPEIYYEIIKGESGKILDVRMLENTYRELSAYLPS